MKKFKQYLTEQQMIDVWQVYASGPNDKPGTRGGQLLFNVFDNEKDAKVYAKKETGGVLKKTMTLKKTKMSQDSFDKTKKYLNRGK